jgi:hypothetical protein
MSKGIAIETILYLLIGVLVVGIVVYLVYTYAFNPIPGQTQCRASAISWCTSCKNAVWTGGPNAPDDLQACASKYFSDSKPTNWKDEAPFCSDCVCDKVGTEKTFCSQIAGVS